MRCVTCHSSAKEQIPLELKPTRNTLDPTRHLRWLQSPCSLATRSPLEQLSQQSVQIIVSIWQRQLALAATRLPEGEFLVRLGRSLAFGSF